MGDEKQQPAWLIMLEYISQKNFHSCCFCFQILLDSMTFVEVRGFVEMIIGNDASLLTVLDTYSQGTAPPSPARMNGVPWCICGHCVDDDRMKDIERKCCRQKRCITRTDRCQWMVIDSDNVGTAARSHSDVTARRPNLDNRNLRHTAYRQYLMWQFGNLGKGNRVVIPSCVVWLIRTKWPAPDGKYTGYKPPKNN